MINVQDVFGISKDIPRFTYVDRAGLDTKFSYLLMTQRHIVIHGASKQGKSCLRKKNLNEDNSVIIHCLPDMPLEDLWRSAFRSLGVAFPTSKTGIRAQTSSKSFEGGVDGGVLLVKGALSVETSKIDEESDSINNVYVSGYDNDLDVLARVLLEKKKRLILEDFHYLSEEMRRKVAFSLKALYELGVYVIIIGIWSEQNLLTYYNGDLTGRIEEIKLDWNEAELREVLSKGEKTLKITFSEELKQEIVNNSFQSVGILQRIAEKVCLIKGVMHEQKNNVLIDDVEIVRKANKQIVDDIGQRYFRIFDVFNQGFKSDTKLKMYYLIFRVMVQIDEATLIWGIPSSKLLKEVQDISQYDVRLTDLIQSLDRIEKLQSQRGITPFLVSYNRSLKMLTLMDREFLFYRKFTDVTWDWD